MRLVIFLVSLPKSRASDKPQKTARYQKLGLTIGPSPRDQQQASLPASGLQMGDSNVNDIKENYGDDSFLTRSEEGYVEDTPRRYINYVIAGGGVSLVSLSLLVCMRTRLKSNKRAQVLPISGSDYVCPRVPHKGA